MFTGLVEAMGKLVERQPLPEGQRFRLEHEFSDISLGESIAVSGACLTVVDFDERFFAVDVSPETLQRTVLGDLQPGEQVNLERAMRLDERMGGHLVTGHVDGVAEVSELREVGDMVDVRLRLPEQLAKYAAEKGSLTVDGVSLTVNAVEGAVVSLWLISHTLAVTTLGRLAPGVRCNVEVDLIARYVERLMADSSR